MHGSPAPSWPAGREAASIAALEAAAPKVQLVWASIPGPPAGLAGGRCVPQVSAVLERRVRVVVCHRPRGLVVAACRRRQQPCRPARHIPTDTVAVIISAVAEAYRVSPQALCSPSRRADLVEARAIAYQLCFESGAGEAAIGRAIGRDHATVRHALCRLERRCSRDQMAMLQDCRHAVRRRLAAQGQQGVRP